MLLYSLLYLTGYEDMTIDQIKNFRQLGSRTAGHPEYGHATGIETTTGPLGQGVGNSVGFALGERIMNAAFGNDLVDHYTYVLAGDGCLMEGISQEALTLAGHLKLNKLIVFWDHNDISIDGPVSLADSTDQLARFRASGWDATLVDGHDPEAIAVAIEAARHSDRPSLIACRTTIGFGAPTKAGTAKAHGSPLGAEEIAGARKFFNWDSPPFEIPADILDAWRAAGAAGAKPRAEWEARLAKADAKLRAEFERRVKGDLPTGLDAALADAFRYDTRVLIEQGIDAREIEVAVETPINIVYGNMPYAVMMASPSDLEDFVAGFSLTEGIVRGADEIRGIAVEPKDEGVIVTVELAPGRFREHLARRRNLSGRTSCGLCGVETIEALGRRIFELMIDTASGKETCSEAFGYGDNEFVPWQVGAVM